jgi:ATP-dependent DNA helicase RecQ
MQQARLALRRHFGYDDFRRGQVDVVQSVIDGRDTLGVLPTGGGKSLCYQVPALVLPGLTVVVSPLISLMKDQVDRLMSRGVPAAFLNSTLRTEEVERRLISAERGLLKLLYVAPERLEGADLQRCLRRARLSLFAVDESHCISEWGHEFRPSFRRIADVTDTLGRPQTVALTATATPAVRSDILRQLRMRSPKVIVGGFDRPNLHYAVRECRTDAEKDRALLEELRSHEQPSIVYAPTRVLVERIARQLVRAGRNAAAYHGGLDDDVRRDVQDAFMSGQVHTIVATNAFGMGIDKPNVRLVVHYAMPGTPEAYYQEAGRGGRDGLPSHCVLLHSFKDRFTHEWFIRGTFPEQQLVDRVHRALLVAQRGGLAPTDAGAVARLCSGATAMEVESAIRLLEQRHVVARGARSMSVRVRLLATPERIRREVTGLPDQTEVSVLRALWKTDAAGLELGTVVNLDQLRGVVRGRAARSALEQLRRRQFVDMQPVDAGLRLTDPSASLASFAIDWDALDRRRASELSKLDTMQRYSYTKKCRRAFVLNYFGEGNADRRCHGCDNCHR